MSDDDSQILSRTERRKMKTRESIREAAARLFRSKGVNDVTVGEICELADLATKTFFNHYSSKDDLVREVSLDFADTNQHVLEQALEHVQVGPQVALGAEREAGSQQRALQ